MSILRKKNMNPSKIEHIGIAVKNLDEAIILYEKLLHTKCYKIEEVINQKVKTAFFQIGNSKIELLEATDSESPIAKFIEKKGEGLHHIAFATDDVQLSVITLENENFTLIDKLPKIGADGMEIAFIHPKSTCGVLTEFCSPLKKA